MNDVYLRPPIGTERKQSVASHFKSHETMNSNPYLSQASIASTANSELMTMSFYRENFLPSNEDYEFFPKILHIPDSITGQNDFSWGLWNWIHSKDNITQDDVFFDRSPGDTETLQYTKVFNYSGNPFQLKPVYTHHSKHLHLERNNIPTPRSEALVNQNKIAKNVTSNAAPTHSIKGLSPTTVPRFYIQVMSFRGEHFTNVSSICCSIDIDNKKVFTGVAPCVKNRDGTVSALFNEAFVFDITSPEVSIKVSIYGLYHKTISKKTFLKNIKETLNIKNEKKTSLRPSFTGVFRNHHVNNNDLLLLTQKASGPKNSTLTKSISIISNTFNMKKSKKESTKNPMDSIDIEGKEIFIGDYDLRFSTKKLNKTTETYRINSALIQSKPCNDPSKKQQQSIVLQTGIYMDEKVKETIAYINEDIHCDYLSVQLSTTTVPVWKRYWVIFKENFLTFYDFEYKERKEPIGKIDIHTLKSIGLPAPESEYDCMPNCFCIEFEEGKDLADIVGVYQKEGDYNEKNEEENVSNNKYERVKPKEELLLKKIERVEVSGSNSNVNSNNTLYSSKKEGLDDQAIKEEEEKKEVEGDDEKSVAEKTEGGEGYTKDLNNVDINIDTIENMIKNISIDVNSSNSNVDLSTSTLHHQEKIPHYEWINRVVTKSSAYFYSDSPSKLTQWIKAIEESPCFQITK